MRTATLIPILLLILAGAATAQDIRGLGQCSMAQMRYYADKGLSGDRIREICEVDGSYNCEHAQCSGQAVDTLIADGFTVEEVSQMCGQPLCAAPPPK